MKSLPKIGIAVAANNIEQETIDRFLESAKCALDAKDIVEVAVGRTFGPYNKSRHVNDSIRKLIQKGCEIIVQTDIDAEWSPELTESTRQITRAGVHFWTPFIRDGMPCTYNMGAWNALLSSDWIRIGGLDERCFGWGGEDDLLHDQCRNAGLRRVMGTSHPVHHDHPDRPHWSANRNKHSNGKKNLKAATEGNFVNYLTDSLPRYKGVTLHVTSRCLQRCPQCCLQNFLQSNPRYDLTEQELDDFLQAVQWSPHNIDLVIVCGGEPLLNPILPLILRRLDEHPRIHRISLFTGLLDGFDLNTLPRFQGTIRVSRYSFNESLITQARKSGVSFQVADRSEHIILPEMQYPDAIPGYCMNPEVFIYQGRVYTCPMVIQNLIRYDMAPVNSPLYSEPLTNRFLDRLRGWKTGGMSTCTGCVGNRNFEKITGWNPN